ncbi:MAG: hypothetical protein GXO47_13180 [Chlorobi bacterium]|nr:hypothetical protein [Chlorobiota bacterium]
MDKQKLIETVVEKIKQLPENKLKEIEDYLDLLIEKYQDDMLIQKGIEDIVQNSKTYEFLKEEDNIYTVNDLKEKYK